MGAQLSGIRIAGVAVVLFSAVLVGVGIHHLIATGTCSSTGYSGSFGPVPKCPSGTGWWIAFMFAGIVGSLVGAMMAGSMSLIFAGIFGAIGFGSLSLLLDAHAAGSTQLFGAAFGGVFAVIGIAGWVSVLRGALGSLHPQQVQRGKTKTTSGGPSRASSPPAVSMGVSSPMSGTTGGGTTPGAQTPLDLMPGLQAARATASGSSVDQLSKLARLHQDGALTDAEFASAKAKLLGEL